MAVNSEDGEYALDCWEDPNQDSDPVTFYADDAGELKAHAQSLLKAGKYKYVVLSQWSDDADDWAELEEFEA